LIDFEFGTTTYSFCHATKIGDAASMVMPGQIVFMDITSPNIGNSGTFKVFATRNYTYSSPEDHLNVVFNVTAFTPTHVQRVVFTLPRDACLFYILGTVQPGVVGTIYMMGGAYSSAFYPGSFDFCQGTSMGDPASLIDPGDVVYMDITMSSVGNGGTFRVFAAHNYTRTTDEDYLALEYGASVQSDLGWQRVVFQLPSRALTLKVVANATSGLTANLNAWSGSTVASRSYFSISFTNSTSLADNSSTLHPGDWLYLDVQPLSQGEVANVTIWTVVLNDSPGLSSPADVSFTEGEEGHGIGWRVTDHVVRLPTFKVYKNGIDARSGLWVNGTTISVPTSSLSLGMHNFTILVDDGFGTNNTDTVMVTITERPAVGGYPPFATIGASLIMIPVIIVIRRRRQEVAS
jgi:hypothetical protein